jgi:hypothetical protein
MQKTALPLVACLLALAVGGAHAQSLWKWRDASGQLHVSDTAPPVGTPAKNIISGPPGGVPPAPSSLAPATTAASAPAAAPSASSVPSALEKKKMAAEQAKSEKEKADKAAVDAQNAAVRKDNCTRAQASLANLQSGQRIARVNSKGEREIMDDSTRATETKHAQDAVASNCGPLPATK